MNSTSRAATFLVVAVAAFVLAQAASAAELGLSVGVQKGTLDAAAKVTAPVVEVSVEASAVVAPAAPTVSAAVDTGAVVARVEVAARPAAISSPGGPGGSTRNDPGARTKGPDNRTTTPRDRSIVPAAPSEGARPAAGSPAPLAARAAQTSIPLEVDLAPLPGRSSGWGASAQAAAAGISGSPVALMGLLLVVVSLVFQPVLRAVGAPRPSLHSFVLARPG